MFTKPLGTSAFVYQREHLGIESVEYVLPVEIKGVCLRMKSHMQLVSRLGDPMYFSTYGIQP